MDQGLSIRDDDQALTGQAFTHHLFEPRGGPGFSVAWREAGALSAHEPRRSRPFQPPIAIPNATLARRQGRTSTGVRVLSIAPVTLSRRRAGSTLSLQAVDRRQTVRC